jgi:hypothetical protein
LLMCVGTTALVNARKNREVKSMSLIHPAKSLLC